MVFLKCKTCHGAGQHRVCPNFLSHLRTQSASSNASALVDIARTLVHEGGDEAYGDLLFWSDATRRCIECWRREAAQTPESARALNERLARVYEVALVLGPGKKGSHTPAAVHPVSGSRIGSGGIA